MTATTVISGMRPCSKCREVKVVSADYFPRNAVKPGGFASTCLPCMRDTNRASYERRKHAVLERQRAAYRADPTAKQVQNDAWRARNPDKVRAIMAKSARKRRAKDPLFRVSESVSIAVRRSMRGAKGGASWASLLGYSVTELRSHLEAQFDERMSWDNYGTHWEIDHIKPVVSFRVVDAVTCDEVKRLVAECWQLSNLRPLEVSANRSKGAKWNPQREVRHGR